MINAIKEAGGSAQDIIRTRFYLININTWKEAARAHEQLFSEIKPVCTFIEVPRFIHPEWLVETEADCILK